MTTVAKLKNTGDLLLKGELNERVPAVLSGLIAHFPFDGNCFDVINGYNPVQATDSGKDFIENNILDWRDPNNWIKYNGTGNLYWDSVQECLVADGYWWGWFKGLIGIDTGKHWYVEALMKKAGTNGSMFLGNISFKSDRVTETASKHPGAHDYFGASNVVVPNTWTKYKNNHLGGGPRTGTSSDTNYATFDPECAFVKPLFIANYSTGVIGTDKLYIKDLKFYYIDNDTSNVTKGFDGVSVEEATTNLVPLTANRLPSYGNTHGTYNTNQYNSGNYFSIGVIGSVTDNIVTLSSVGRAIYTYDVLRPQTTGGGVTANVDYFVKKISSTQFSLHAYDSSQDGSKGYAVHDSIKNDIKVPINATSFPTMWRGAPHLPNSALVKEIIPLGFKGIHDCIRCHGEHKPEGEQDYMAYGVTPPVTSGITYTFSFWVRAVSPKSLGTSITFSLYTTAGWTLTKLEGDIVFGDYEWRRVVYSGVAPGTGGTGMYFRMGKCATIDIAEIMCEQKTFPTSFVDGSRGEGDFKLTSVLNPHRGSVAVDVTFHEDNTINGLQGSDHYDFGNQLAYNVANAWWFKQMGYWFIIDSNAVTHGCSLVSPIVREVRTHLVFVYDDTDGTMKIYKNGKLDGTAGHTDAIGLWGSLGTNWTHSGHALTTSYKMCQTIHSLSFYNRPLTGTEVKRLYGNQFELNKNGDLNVKSIDERSSVIPSGSIYFPMGLNARDENNLIIPKVEIGTVYENESLKLGGGGVKLNYDSLAPKMNNWDEFSIYMWVTYTTSGVFRLSGTWPRFYFGVDNNNHAVFSWMYGGSQYSVTGTSVVPINKRVFIGCSVKKSNFVDVYYNGIREGNYSNPNFEGNINDFEINGMSPTDVNHPLNASIQDVVFVPIALTPTEMSNIYKSRIDIKRDKIIISKGFYEDML